VQPVLLQPLPILEQPWKVVCMNFVEGLPKSNRYDTIMVVIDTFTKVWAFYYFGPSLHSLASSSSLHGKYV
jgi:hypothetical protein